MGLLHLRLPAVSNGSAIMPGRTCTKAASASAGSATERGRGGAHCHGLDNLRAAAREHAHGENPSLRAPALALDQCAWSQCPRALHTLRLAPAFAIAWAMSAGALSSAYPNGTSKRSSDRHGHCYCKIS